jgi:uncharacterized protein YdeI (YjbR/CyaY-like superfamily)
VTQAPARCAIAGGYRSPAMEPTFFATPEELRAWFEEHHATETELLVGFYTSGSGRPSITWPESVDQALCFGWIDGVRRRIDDESYSIRFTPRKPRSNWSAINVKRVGELTEQGRMHPAGLAAFERRSDDETAIYAYEQRKAAELEPAMEQQFKRDERAWAWFQAQPPSYRRTATHWVMSAKRRETRERRLQQLIADSRAGRTVAPLTRPTPGGAG